MGYAHLEKGNLNDAYIEFQKAIDLNPKNKTALNYLGLISASFEKYDEAISYYKRAIKADPDYSDAMNNLGVTYTAMGQWDEAIKYFRAALKNPIYRTPSWAYSNLGYAYYMKGDYASANKALDEAILRNPVSPKAIFIRGLIHVRLHNDDAAIDEFIKAIGIFPDYLDAHWELGMAYVRTGKKDKALKHFEVIAEKAANSELGMKAVEQIELLKY
jgi:tetratricopeptide (TPR) repeat protein